MFVAATSGLKALEQTGDHFLYFEKFDFSFVVPADLEHSKITGEQQKVLKLACRSHGNIKKLSKFGPAPSAASFRNVCRYGTGCAPDLAAETKTFVGRKFTGQSVRMESQFVAPTPNLQLAEILHNPPLPNSVRRPWNYLQLTTNNCQLCDGGFHAD
jgi:hypothetical protein